MKAVLLAMSVGLLFSACIATEPFPPSKPGEQTDQKSVKELRQESFDDIDVDACVAGGGEVRQDGLLGLYRCTTPYDDAGVICRDSSDCTGRCMGDDDVTDNEAGSGNAIGVCEADDSPFGCFATIDAGTPSPFICVD